MATTTDPILTPVGRVSWPYLAKPDDNGKYGMTMIFDKDTDIKALKKLVLDCIKEEWGDKFKPNQLSLPFKAGNDKADDEGNVRPEHVDATLVTVGTKYAPTCLDGTKGKKQIPTADVEAEVYPGCYAIAQVHAYAWEYKEGNKVMKRGVSLGLLNVLKYKDGERLGGGKRFSAEDAFADVEVDASADDPNNYNSGSGFDLDDI